MRNEVAYYQGLASAENLSDILKAEKHWNSICSNNKVSTDWGLRRLIQIEKIESGNYEDGFIKAVNDEWQKLIEMAKKEIILDEYIANTHWSEK